MTIFYKNSPYIWWLWEHFEKHYFLSWLLSPLFGQLLEKLGHFLFQHLVTLFGTLKQCLHQNYALIQISFRVYNIFCRWLIRLVQVSPDGAGFQRHRTEKGRVHISGQAAHHHHVVRQRQDGHALRSLCTVLRLFHTCCSSSLKIPQ